MIHIVDDYYFAADGMQYTLIRKFKESDKKSKSFGKQLGYFTSLEHLLDRLGEIITAENVNAGEIAEYIEALTENKKTLQGLSEFIKSNTELPMNELTDRPCAVCKHHSENGCTEWRCIFEGV